MATVCGASLALGSAGVPISGVVAGIAMGVVIDGDKSLVLTDITAEEDGYGDMDFKVAGTSTGLTALQLDTKRSSIPLPVLESALNEARSAIDQILQTLNSNTEDYASQSTCHAVLRIDSARIGQVIGSGARIYKSFNHRAVLA